jgi:lycopene beta-cyclase
MLNRHKIPFHTKIYNTPSPVRIIGDGCSALSLAARANFLPHHQITIITPSDAPKVKDHIWGFWRINGLETAESIAKHKWLKWLIKTPQGNVVLTSEEHCYYALRRRDWETYCRDQALKHGVIFCDQDDVKPCSTAQIIDSRPPKVSSTQMFQYFIGWEIQAKTDVFDPTTAILMDFCCDQSRGIHFMYILPFSKKEALIESTMYTQNREPDTFFESQIQNYLYSNYGIDEFKISKKESGAIPLGWIPKNTMGFTGLGSNGGAIRPSSGYAFTFIQKQISTMISSTNSKNTSPGDSLKVESPHKSIDLWMDEVFVTVLRNWPNVADSLFLRLAQALSGDEFALFLSGNISWRLRTKVIVCMPKWLFVKAASLCLLNFYKIALRHLSVRPINGYSLWR